MKQILTLLVVSLALANAFLFRPPSPVTTASTIAPEGITTYFTAFFAHFGLDQPNQLLNCFDDKNTVLYLKHLYEVSELAQNEEKRDKVKVHLGWLKLAVLHKLLEPLHGCITATQDYSDLLNALGAKERNPKLFMLAKFIYYQANFGKLAQELPKITGALDNKDWQGAGELKAALVKTMSDELKDQGLALHALNALWNGVHIGLDLPDAQSVWGCWDKETARFRLEFIYGLANAVASGKWSEAAVNTEKWYQEKGNELLKKIPHSAWQCWKDSSDTKAESDKLKIDITSHEFFEKVSKFAHKHQASYWQIQKGIKSNLDEHNFIHAGAAYAHQLKAAASSKW